MRRGRRVLSVLLLWGSATAAIVPVARASSPPPEPDISNLIDQLGDADPTVRVRAFRKLSDAGIGARPQLLATLIASLSDPDPSIRSSAALRLVDLGAMARPALIAAANENAAPELRQALERSLLQGPWIDPGDPPTVQQVLRGYERASIEARRNVARQLGEIPDAVGRPALLRILQHDPTAAVRWRAEAVLRTSFPDAPPLPELRTLASGPSTAPTDPVASNAPQLALAAWASHSTDPDFTARLLRRAIDLDAAAPAALHGELDFAYLWLEDRAIESQDYPAALELLRQQATRTVILQPWDDPLDRADPVAQLFALHASHGPLPGFANDLWTFRTSLAQPQVLYALAELCERRDEPATALALQIVAATMGGLSTQAHAEAGKFLADQGWVTPAVAELHMALVLNALSRTPDQPSRSDAEDIAAANIYFQLARVAGLVDNELSVARLLEHAVRDLHGNAISRMTQFGETSPWPTADAWAEVHWHYLRAARASGDIAAMREHLQQLMDLDKLNQVLHNDPGLVSDIVPALIETGHAQEAQRCFDTAYADLRNAVAARPDDAEAKNDLAWLCARCGKHLQEALKLADAAAAAEPGTSAYLDTDAEAHYRLGQAAAAVDLEQRALRLTPGDHFMQQQLARFRAAAATQPAQR